MPDPHLSDSLEIMTGCGCVITIVFDMFAAKNVKQTDVKMFIILINLKEKKVCLLILDNVSGKMI